MTRSMYVKKVKAIDAQTQYEVKIANVREKSVEMTPSYQGQQNLNASQ
jgi:hypothetical protein